MSKETDMNNIPEFFPLRLAVGSYQRGSGQGCAMNLISFENGDRRITDYPACSAKHLAVLVQTVNDVYCEHRDEKNRLCPACSVAVLALAHRTVGTAGAPDEQIYAWTAECLDSPSWGAVRFAYDRGVEVLHRVADMYRRAASGAMPSVEEWSAFWSADASADGCAAESVAQSAAQSAARAAAQSAAGSAAFMDYTHTAIDAWERITGTTPPVVNDAAVSEAVARMLEVSA